MKRAPRALGFLGLILLLPAVAASAQIEAAEITVEFVSPDRARVHTRISTGHPLAGSVGFHALTPSAGAGWQRIPAPFERDAAGALVFEDTAWADEAGWVQISVPLPDTAPEPGADSAFSTRITPPPGYRIADAFPAVTADAAESRTVSAHLPAPPSLLRFRVVPEDRNAIGLAAIVDGALALVLIGLAVFGARRLLSPAGTSPQ